jgi:mRNA-degrading endonuclease HigB of HigAB toxin-antitoxin module
MEIVGKKILEKLKRKNKGNISLVDSIDDLIKILEENEFQNQSEIIKIRPDADCVHNDGFYFFNISIHRTLILIEFEENGEATIVWCGNHDEYEKTFKNNKDTIKKWLKDREWIN